MQISKDGTTLTIHLENVPVVDAISFPPPVPSNYAADEVDISPYQLTRARASFEITYTKTKGTARHIHPETDDPLSPLNWAGKMWNATNAGSFTVAYDDGSFSASGNFDSSGNFGEMGKERNGSFARHDEEDDNDGAEEGEQSSPSAKPTATAQLAAGAVMKQPVKQVLLKGRVPVKVSQ